jgi:hypothetical protein
VLTFEVTASGLVLDLAQWIRFGAASAALHCSIIYLCILTGLLFGGMPGALCFHACYFGPRLLPLNNSS